MKTIVLKKEWCKGCFICGSFCPQKVFDRDLDGKPIIARPQDCAGCGLCQLRCPDFAITVEE